MRSCDRYTELIVDHRYGVIDDREQARALREHLDSCSACAAASVALGLLGSSLRAHEAFPQEASVDWDAFSRRTIARAVAPVESAGGWRALLGVFTRPMTISFTPAWAAAGLLVVSGLALATWSLLPVTAPQTPTPVPVADHALVPDENLDLLAVNLARRNTAQYLRDTRSVLITLLDVEVGCDKDSVDITAERAQALELLRRQRLVAVELSRSPLSRAQDITEDLQQLLLEISSLADCAPAGDIQTLRDVVEKRQILVRMELLTQELARRGGIRA